MADARTGSMTFPAACMQAFAAACLALVLFCALPTAAQAQIRQNYQMGYDEDQGTATGQGANTTTGVSDLEITDDFSCNADGSTDGTLYVNQQCEMDGLFGIMANVVCRIENLFGTVLGLVYCSVQNAILKPLLAFFTLYVTVYGALVILGMIRHTFVEAATRILKIALVSAIAMNADIAIGVGYKFYISAAQTSVAVVFQLFDTDSGDAYSENPAMADMIAGGYMASPTNPDKSKALQSGEHWMASIDSTVHKIIGFFVKGGIGFVIVLAGLFVFMPPLFFILIYMIISMLKSLVQAIIGYLLALLGITFMFTVAPLFVSFALFRVTSGWFETWLKYLASFTLQLMIVFTFMMILVMVDLVSFFQNIGNMVRQYQYVFSFGFIHVPLNVYTLCRVERKGGNSGDIIYYKFDQNGLMSGAAGQGNRYEGFPKCIEPYTLEGVLNGSHVPPGLDPQQMKELAKTIDDFNGGIYDLPTGDLPPGLQFVAQIIEKINDDLKIPFMELITTTDLIFFLLVRFITVIILTFLLERFMKKVPHLASYLAGTEFSGRLAGGEADPGEAPGIQDTTDFAGLDTAYAKFKAASLQGGNYPQGFIRSAPARFARGVSAAVGGAGYGMLRKGLVNAGNLGLRGDLRMELAESAEILESKREGLFAPSRGGIGRPAGVYHPGGRAGRTLPSTFKGHRHARRGM